MTNRLYHIQEVAHMIEHYIFMKKSVRVIIILPGTDTKQMELFLKAANVAMAFHGI